MYDLTILGYIEEKDLQVIEHWGKLIPENGVVVEVGCHLGRSSYCWGKSIPETATLYCIDSWHDIDIKKLKKYDISYDGPMVNRYDVFLENTKTCKNIIPIKGKAPNITYPGNSIDIFYIDASHHNPSDLKIILYFTKFLKPNAKICGHDYTDEWPDVKFNVKILEHLYKTKVKLFEGTFQWEIQT